MGGLRADAGQGGAGAKFRLHGCDPDQAEAAARPLGFKVLVETTDKASELRAAAASDLVHLGPAAKEAVPSLIAALQDDAPKD